MNRLIYSFVILILCSGVAFAQKQTPSSPTPLRPDSVYTYADFMPIPILRSCDRMGIDSTFTLDSLRNCGISGLQTLISKELRYPQNAQRDSIQGRVVISFVIDTFGVLTDAQIVKEIGGGCGDEALRIFTEMTEAGLRWVPAMHNQKRVPLRMMWPIRFQIKEYTPPPYYFNDKGIKIYETPDTYPQYAGGEDSLLSLILHTLAYPASERASCKTGVIEYNLLIMPNKTAEVEHLMDYSGLGLEFHWEASRMLNTTRGRWTPATYRDTTVAALYPLRVLFKSDAPACKQTNERFDQSVMEYAEGIVAYDARDFDKAIERFTKAIELFPQHTEYLYYRGSAYAAKGEKEKACADYKAIEAVRGAVWFPQLYRLVCGQ